MRSTASIGKAIIAAVRAFLGDTIGIATCSAIFLAANAVAPHLGLPLPSGIVGALALAAALATRALPMARIAPGADRLLRHLGLLFVPAAVLSLRQRALLMPALLPLAVVVVVSSVVGIVVTGALTAWLARRESTRGEDQAAAREEEPGT